jgi:1-acyl-sn-glycerol-3-phosphate acyltransferase
MSRKIHPLASAIAFLARVVTAVQVRHLEYAPQDRPAVYFANHTSHLDALLIWASLPPVARARTRPVAARAYWSARRVRRYLATRVFRAVLVDRASEVTTGDGAGGTAPTRRPRAIEEMLATLRGGDSLIIFPEGTRGKGDAVARFRTGLFHLASRMPEVNIVPVYLENLGRMLPKGEVLLVPLLGRVTFGKPFRIGEGEPKADFLERSRAALIALDEKRRRP